MTGRYALRDPETRLLLEVEEFLAHDDTGFCNGRCLEQFHGGRHRSGGRHTSYGVHARAARMAEWVTHDEVTGRCMHVDPHPGGKHRGAAA